MENEIIKKVLQRLLRESNDNEIPDARGLAVYFNSYGHERSATIYDINKMVASVKELKLDKLKPKKKKKKQDLEVWTDDEVIDAIVPSVVGYVQINRAVAMGHGRCFDSWEVQYTAGPRMGKLLYGLGFAMTDNGKLTSDRFSVSPFALKRWEKENSVRQATVKFDNIDEPKTPTPFDDCIVFEDPDKDVINKAYMEKGWEKPLLTDLRKQHERVKKYMSTKIEGPDGGPLFTQEDVDFVDEQISIAGAEFFNTTYKAYNE